MQVLGDQYEESAVVIGPFENVWSNAAQGVTTTIVGTASVLGGRTARLLPREMLDTIRPIAFRIYERQRRSLGRNVGGWEKHEAQLKEAFNGESARDSPLWRSHPPQRRIARQPGRDSIA